MSIKNPYFPKAPLVAREFIGMPSPYSLIFGGSINYSGNKKGTRMTQMTRIFTDNTGKNPCKSVLSVSSVFKKRNNKGIRAGLIDVTPATKGAFEDKGFKKRGRGVLHTPIRYWDINRY